MDSQVVDSQAVDTQTDAAVEDNRLGSLQAVVAAVAAVVCS